MPFRNLGSFLKALKKDGDLRVITEEVDPEYEAGEIAQRAVREGKPALIFTNVKGSRIPLAMNALATPRRIERALGRPPGEVGEELVRFAERMKPPSLGGLWASRATVGRALSARVAIRGGAPPPGVREPPRLSHPPPRRCLPRARGGLLYLSLVLT